MAHDEVVNRITNAWTAYWTSTRNRWFEAVEAATENQYTGDRMATDLVSFWADTLNLWAGFVPSVGSPTIPVAFLRGPPSADLESNVFLTARVPKKAYPEKSELVQVGGSQSFPFELELSASREKLTVKATAPDQPGLYKGIVHLEDRPIALVVAKIG